MAPALSAPVENAQRTVLAGGRWDGTNLVAFTRKEIEASRMQWQTLESETRIAAANDFQKVQVTYKRDQRKVIEYAELQSKEPLVASAILAPELSTTFADSLGEVLLVVVPNRNHAFIFPQLGPDVSRYSALVWNAYRESAYPVSVELFECRNGVLRAVGLFEP